MEAKNDGYMAGILDGEGCISIFLHKTRVEGKYSTNLAISVYQSDLRLMNWMVHHYGGKYYSHLMKNSSRPGYSWFPPRGEALENFLLQILPYLIMKKEQAKLALEYLRLGPGKNPEKRAELAMRCSILNRKKSPEAIRQTVTSIVGQDVAPKIWSELHGDMQNATVETQIA